MPVAYQWDGVRLAPGGNMLAGKFNLDADATGHTVVFTAPAGMVIEPGDGSAGQTIVAAGTLTYAFATAGEMAAGLSDPTDSNRLRGWCNFPVPHVANFPLDIRAYG